MEFELNEQRIAYLKSKGKIVLNACPGSGKTTAIARKLIELQKDSDSSFGKYTGIACLSFTNTAKDEINNKFAELNGEYLRFPHKVSTIDSFINKYITLPFYYLQNTECKRPKILDSSDILDSMWEIKYKDKNGNLRDGLKTSLLRFKGKDNRNMFYSYPPSKIRPELDGSFSIEGKLPSDEKVELNLFKEYCVYVVNTRFSNGLISSNDSSFIALSLLRKYPRIAELLAQRFPHIIVDEAQDNSAIQHAIFEKLIEQGLSNIEFVGDPYQSLYEWRDADPKLFVEKFDDGANWNGLSFTENRRSPQRIIDIFSLLRRANEQRINSVCTEDKCLPINIYRYTVTNTPLIVQHFDRVCQRNGLIDNQIVVRGHTLKNQMLGKHSDQKPWKSVLPYSLIAAVHQFNGNEVKAAIKSLRSIVVSLIAAGKEYHEVKELEKDLSENYYFNATLLETFHDMPRFSLSISDWTTRTQSFLKERFELKLDVNFDIKKRKSSNFDKTILTDSLDQHFVQPYSEGRIPITTVHQVKGKSLDSILVFFNESKHKDNITFSDIVSNNQEFPSEKQRIIYVALSRPKHFLAMAFPQSISEEEIRSKFGNYVSVIDQNNM